MQIVLHRVVEGGTHQNIVWGYPDNFKPIYIFFKKSFKRTKKRKSSKNQLTKQK